MKSKLPALGFALLVCFSLHAQENKSSYNFIEGIQMTFSNLVTQKTTGNPKDTVRVSTTAIVKAGIRQGIDAALETFMPFQFKYAILLDQSVEKLTNLSLYKTIDQWYGTRYRYGGTTAKGIDCSAFMQKLATYAFGFMLPRTAREQFAAMISIDKEQLKEGDFVFFNTTGGVSHVGMYLQNNKFVHSSSSQGVSIGDLDDAYWSKRFIGAKRIAENTDETSSNSTAGIN